MLHKVLLRLKVFKKQIFEKILNKKKKKKEKKNFIYLLSSYLLYYQSDREIIKSDVNEIILFDRAFSLKIYTMSSVIFCR